MAPLSAIVEGAEYLHDALAVVLPIGFPLDRSIGLIETSIGKMVPFTPSDIAERDPLLVHAEAYNTLILDGKAFKNSIP